MINVVLISFIIGCFLGMLRYTLDDKWHLLPEKMCRFCVTTWASVILHAIPVYLIHETLFIICVPISVTVSAFSYMYIKSAN